jgi:hypothetical protein
VKPGPFEPIKGGLIETHPAPPVRLFLCTGRGRTWGYCALRRRGWGYLAEVVGEGVVGVGGFGMEGGDRYHPTFSVRRRCPKGG